MKSGKLPLISVHRAGIAKLIGIPAQTGGMPAGGLRQIPPASSHLRLETRQNGRLIGKQDRGHCVDLVTIAIILGLLAIVYGFITSRQVLGSPAGNEKMQRSPRRFRKAHKPT
jgi:hypothetical protein